MQKPTVRYSPFGAFIVVGTSAYVVALDHPSWGHSPVTTSTVQSYDKATGEFETLNTRYVPDLSEVSA